MRFASGSAFRQALEDRLRHQTQSTGTPLTRLRTLVAFDRFLARLMTAQPGRWVLKGGLSLELRLGERARTTKDIDLLLRMKGDPLPLLAQAARLDLGDWFTFEVAPAQRASAAELSTLRYPARALLDGRVFEAFHIDVGRGDPLVEAEDPVTAPPLLVFAGLEPATILCYPPSQQLAEKLHAYTIHHAGSAGSRVRDLVDILLIGSHTRLNASRLRSALVATFEVRATHPMPPSLPPPPASWAGPFSRLAREVGLEWHNLETAFGAARRFLDPVLQLTSLADWDPTRWVWVETEEKPRDI